ncbi:hypothetical protein JTB14_016143 [Gonioctena quinquepunctata]|nr:hypothetical protein JTB14_016143 [Gonioctena quinquepunctata]
MRNMSKALQMCGSNRGSNECSKVDKPSKMFEYLRSSGLTREKMNSIKLWKRRFVDLCENFSIEKSKRNCYKIKKKIMRKFSTEHQPDNMKDSFDPISVLFEGNEIVREMDVHTILESCRSPIPEENTIDIIPKEVLDDEESDEESDEDYVEEELHHDTDSEVSAEESDDPNFRRWSEDGPNYVGKDGQTLWKIHHNVKYSRTKTQNLITKVPGVKPHAINARSVYETWNMIITDQMIEDIVTFTNIYLQSIRNKYSRPRDVLDTDFDEMRAMFGISYMAGVLKSNHTSLADSWNTDSTAPEFFRMVMSKNRFYLLLRALRFDDIRTRVERKKWDELAPIRQLFDMFQGSDLDWGTWKTLNRLRCQMGRCKNNLLKWRHAEEETCECGESQTMEHLLPIPTSSMHPPRPMDVQ